MVDVQPELERETRDMGFFSSTKRHEIVVANGRHLFMHEGFCVGLLGGEPLGRVSKSRKHFALLHVRPKDGGGYEIEFIRAMPRKEADSLKINKKIHFEKTIKPIEVACKVHGDRCQLLTMAPAMPH